MNNKKHKSVIECHYLLKINMPEEFQKKFEKWEREIIYKAPEYWLSGSAWSEYMYYLNLNLPKLGVENYQRYPWLKELNEKYKNYCKS